MQTKTTKPVSADIIIEHCLATMPDGFESRRRLCAALAQLSPSNPDHAKTLREMSAALDTFTALQREFDF